ncbi:MAG TPA: amidase, partial [Sphingobacteriaceae bacterium]
MKLLSRKTTFIVSACSLSFVLGGFITQNAGEEKLTVAIVQSAQKLLGLQFSTAEADSMLSGLESQKQDYAELRKLRIANSISPALQFNPIPVGYQFPDQVNSFKVAPVKVMLPANRDDLAFYTVRELAELLKTGQITSVELTRFFISRLRQYNETLLNVVSFTEERALKQAAAADAEIKAGKYRGLLHGIPYGVKDLLAVKGTRTTWGSVPYKDQVVDTDAAVVQQLDNEGAVLIAKMTLGELAMGDVWFGGKTRNPWNVQRGSSGSSAGSASAVAAGCLPFAVGSETLGSIVSPSTECGTTGLRPTFGRISKHGAMALSWSMDKLGPITRSVEDLAIVFNAVHGADGKDLSVVAAPFAYSSPSGRTSLKGFRIGYLKADFDRRYANKASDSLTLVKLRELGA